VSGHLSTWRKWSFSLVNSEKFLESTKEPWIKIGKDRSVRKFRMVERDQIEEVDPRSLAIRGCIFEFTRLNDMRDSIWCSIGIEAFRDFAESKENNVKSFLTKLLKETRCPNLPAEISMDYPSRLSFLHMSSSKL
jgi:hypothetical protein